MKKSHVLFTDGACSGNPGPGGWGVLFISADGLVQERGGHVLKTTNNQMELRATIEGLACITGGGTEVDLWTDSTYVIRGITQWIHGWRKRGWQTQAGEPVANRDLWEELAGAARNLKVNWYYVRGHAEFPGNDRVDEIAVAFSKGESPFLYRGPANGYDVDYQKLPPSGAMPEQKADRNGGGQKKTIYVSLVQGEAKLHATWSGCEQAVKGRAGARFKKAASETEAAEILNAWGFKGSLPLRA